jgi:hypothetical protein
MIQEWNSSGVKLVGTFGGYGEGVGGYGHYAILEVDDLDMVSKLNDDLFGGESRGCYERYSLDVGHPSVLETSWEPS